MGSFKCCVTLEGVGGYMPKRYEALRGVGWGGGVTSALRNVFFLANTVLPSSCPRVRRGFQNKLAQFHFQYYVPVHNVNNKNMFTH